MIDFDDLDDIEEEQRQEEEAVHEKLAQEQAAREQLAREEAAREEAARERAAQEQAAQEEQLSKEEDQTGYLSKSLLEMSEEEYAALPKPTYQMNVPCMKRPVLAKIWDTQEPGDHYRILFPHSLELIKTMGAEWLTKAFHIAGTMPLDNKVKKLVKVIGLSLDPTKGEAMGGAGVKVILELEYEKPDKRLHTGMFVKIPHPYAPSNERFKISCMWYCDEPEIMFNRILSTITPFKVPKYYFGDISRKNTNTILINEKLDFASTWKDNFKPFEIQPALSKSRDWEIPGKGLSQYYALATCHARFTAAYHLNKLGDKEKLGHCFTGYNEEIYTRQLKGWPPDHFRKPHKPEFTKYFQDIANQGVQQVRGIVQVALEFTTKNCPQIFSKDLREEKFLQRFLKESLHVAQYQGEINTYLTNWKDYFSLTHINMQIDNAYYFLNDEGTLEGGLLDWGSVSFGNSVACMVGNWTSAEPEIMEEHDEKIMKHFQDELEKHGGPKLDFEVVLFHARLSQATSAMSHAANLAQLYAMHPKRDSIWKDFKSIMDPRIVNVFLMRAFITNWRNFLTLWRSSKRSPYKVFLDWLEANKDFLPKKEPLDPALWKDMFAA